MPLDCQKIEAAITVLQARRAKIQDRVFALRRPEGILLMKRLEQAREFRGEAREAQEFADKEAQNAWDGVIGFDEESNYEKILARLAKKQKTGKSFSVAELKFVWELQNDPYSTKAYEITSKRNKRQDYARILELPEISVMETFDQLNPETKFYIGNVNDRYRVPASASRAEVEAISQIIRLNSDLTEVATEIKEKLTEWRGSIVDNSEEFHYSKLKKVWFSLLTKAKTVRAESLVECWTVVADDARQLYLPELESCRAVFSIDAQTVECRKLKFADEIGLSNANYFYADSLLEMTGELRIPAVETVDLPVLSKVDGIIAKNAKSFNARDLSVTRYIVLTSGLIQSENIKVSPFMKTKIQWKR